MTYEKNGMIICSACNEGLFWLNVEADQIYMTCSNCDAVFNLTGRFRADISRRKD